MNEIGIGILSYYGLDVLQRAIEAYRRYTAMPYKLVVFDNSENWEIGEWLRRSAQDVHLIKSPQNVGCARSRNRLVEWFRSMSITHAVIADQDVCPVAPAWDVDMLDVFAAHPDTAIVGWYLVVKQMGPGYKPDATGMVDELPGACNMYALDAVCAGDDPRLRGWWPEYFAYRFDSDMCLSMAKKGYKTRVVWPDTGKIVHPNPHQGVRRNPRMKAIQQASRKIFARRVEELGFKTRLAL